MLTEMKKQQDVIRYSVCNQIMAKYSELGDLSNQKEKTTLQYQAELITVLNYWKGNKDKLLKFQDQMKEGNFI